MKKQTFSVSKAGTLTHEVVEFGADADARCRAAAPELLSHLMTLVDILRDHTCSGYCAVCDAQRLITRIEGGT